MQKAILTFVLLLLVLPAPSLIGVATSVSKHIHVTADSYSPATTSQGTFVEPTQVAENGETLSTGQLPHPNNLTLSASSREALTTGATPLDAASNTITIIGRGMFRDDAGNWVPMRYVLAELWKDNGGGSSDYAIASNWTDEYGSFSFTVNDDNPSAGTGARDMYVRIWAIGKWDWWTLSDPLDLNTPINLIPYWQGYYFDTPDVSGAIPWGSSDYLSNYGLVFPPTEISAAWLVGDAAYAEAQWIYDQVGWSIGKNVPIFWPSGTDAVFKTSDEAIHLPANDDSHITAQHEYGHAVMYYMYGRNPPPGSSPNPHYPPTESPDGGIALKEGWAEFMQCVVDNNPNNFGARYIFSGGMNIETNTWYNGVTESGGTVGDSGDMDGNVIEGSVASILWDVFDPVDITFDKGDNMSIGFSEIFWTFYYYRPYDIENFFSAWALRNPSSLGSLATIFWNYGINEDIFPPEGSIYINWGAAYTNSPWVSLVVSASDYGSGVSWMRFMDDTRQWSSWEPYFPFKSWNLPSGDGLKWVAVQFRDGVGLVSDVFWDFIILDTTPPTGSILINGGNIYTTSPSVTLSLTYSDGEGVPGAQVSGVSRVRYSNDGVFDTEPWESPASTKSWTLSLGDGVKAVWYQVEDAVGWYTESVDYIILDTVRPTGSITINYGAAYTNNRTVTLYTTYYDATSGVSLVEYSDDGVWDNEEATTPSTYLTWTLPWGDGTKTVYYRILDAAGWWSQTYNDTIILDTISPIGSMMINNDAKYTNSISVELNLWATDPKLLGDDGPVAYVLLSNDGFSSFQLRPYGTTLQWNLTSGDGIKTVSAIFLDPAFNRSPIYNATIILDTTPPTGSININKDAKYTTTTNVKLYLKYDDTTSGVYQVRYSNDGKWDTEPWETPSDRKAWNLTAGEGTKTVYYQIIDKVGWLSITYNDTIIFSLVVPQVTSFDAKPNPFSPNKDGVKDTTTINATFNVVVNWELDLKDLAGVTLRSWTGSSNSLSVIWDGTVKGAVVPDGDYAIQLSGQDTSGHPFTSHVKTVTVDTIAPTVTNISVAPTSFNPSHGETTTISYTLSEECLVTIKIYGAKGVVIRTLLHSNYQTPGSHNVIWDGRDNGGHIVPAGTYTIKIYIEDNAGNVAFPYPITLAAKVIE